MEELKIPLRNKKKEIVAHALCDKEDYDKFMSQVPQDQSPELKALLEKAPTSQDTSATDFIAKFRSYRDALSQLKRDAYYTQDAVDRNRMRAAAKEGDKVFGVIKDTLDKGLGPYAPQFKWLTQGYSDQIYPLRENPIMNPNVEGQLPDNIIKSLRGPEPGNALVRELIKQDPEALRNVVGQRYAQSPDEVLNPNENMREYLNEMPELQHFIGDHQNNVVQGLKQKTLAKNLSLEEKVKAENALSDAVSKRNKARNIMKGIGYAGFGAGEFGWGAEQLKRLFNPVSNAMGNNE